MGPLAGNQGTLSAHANFQTVTKKSEKSRKSENKVAGFNIRI